jgi:hypothetical protein
MPTPGWTHRVDPQNVRDVDSTTTTSGPDTSIELPAITPTTKGARVVRFGGSHNASTAGGTITAPADHSDRRMFNGAGTAKRPGNLRDIAREVRERSRRRVPQPL